MTKLYLFMDATQELKPHIRWKKKLPLSMKYKLSFIAHCQPVSVENAQNNNNNTDIVLVELFICSIYQKI